MLADMRYGLRQLRRAPGFAITAILTLAVGIGATTAIFTLVYDVMLKPLPFAHSDRLVVVEEQVAEFKALYPSLPVSVNHFNFWKQQGKSFQASALLSQERYPLGLQGHPKQVEILKGTPGIFSVFQTAPVLGRAFTEQEGQRGHDAVVVLMYDLWRTEFHKDPGILGKVVQLNGAPFTVIGVMPEAFRLPVLTNTVIETETQLAPEAIIPLSFSQEQLQATMGEFNYFGVARLREGVSAPQANDDLNGMERNIASHLSAEDKATLSAIVTPMQEKITGKNKKPLLFLLAAVAGLLIVGCLNLTNLLLARAFGHRQQIAVASALGATKAEILLMAMREIMVISSAGGLLGIGFAAALVPFMQQFLPRAIDFRGTLHLDLAGAACALALSTLAALLAGIIPALISARTQPQEVLHSEAKLASESRGSKRVRSILVTAEVAISVSLVLFTGLFTTSMAKLMKADRGFESDQLYAAEINLPGAPYSNLKSRTPFYRALLTQLSEVPGAQNPSIASFAPFTGNGWSSIAFLPGDSRPIAQRPMEAFRWMGPEYLQSLKVPLIAGRNLSANDEGKNYAVISQLTAKTLWPGQTPVGQHFNLSPEGKPEQDFTVIGVVGDTRTLSMAKPDPMMIYVPYWHRNGSSAWITLRSSLPATAVAEALRKAVWSLDANIPAPTVQTMGSTIAASVENQRFEMKLLILFATSALLLAGLGIYGVVTYSVTQRQKEIGLRMALGAQRGAIYRMIMQQGMIPVLAGAFAGVLITFVAAKAIGALLFQISPYNPGITLAAAAVLLAVGITACLLPAKHAADIEPMRSLRE